MRRPACGDRPDGDRVRSLTDDEAVHFSPILQFEMIGHESLGNGFVGQEDGLSKLAALVRVRK